jgi:phosphoglycerol transferase MdoB-like AlkP superfamily enzyme
MSEEQTKTTINLTAPTLSLLGVAFVVLKLCDVIQWSWWYVLMPFYLPIGLLLAFVVVMFIIYVIAILIGVIHSSLQ